MGQLGDDRPSGHNGVYRVAWNEWDWPAPSDTLPYENSLSDRISMDQDDWTHTKRRFPVGTVVTGSVAHHAPFGFFVSLPDDIVGLVELSWMPRGATPTDPDSYPQIGATVTAVVICAADYNQQLRLSMRPEDLDDPTSLAERIV